MLRFDRDLGMAVRTPMHSGAMSTRPRTQRETEVTRAKAQRRGVGGHGCCPWSLRLGALSEAGARSLISTRQRRRNQRHEAHIA
jgi:hypothetical protein